MATAAESLQGLPRTATLTESQRRTVIAILTQHLPGEPVWLFGSRASGRARPFSDIDLLVAPRQPLGWPTRAALRDAFEASDLPFRVDLVDVRDLPPGTRLRVDAEKLPLIDD